jgi:hypothetical protein
MVPDFSEIKDHEMHKNYLLFSVNLREIRLSLLIVSKPVTALLDAKRILGE